MAGRLDQPRGASATLLAGLCLSLLRPVRAPGGRERPRGRGGGKRRGTLLWRGGGGRVPAFAPLCLGSLRQLPHLALLRFLCSEASALAEVEAKLSKDAGELHEARLAHRRAVTAERRAVLRAEGSSRAKGALAASGGGNDGGDDGSEPAGEEMPTMRARRSHPATTPSHAC